MSEQPERDPKELTMKSENTLVHFYSRQATRLRLHLVIPRRGADDQQLVAEFENSSLFVDTKTPKGKQLAAAIREHPCFGATVLEIKKADDDSDVGRMTNLLREIHDFQETATQSEVAAKLVAMFTTEELRRHDIDPFTQDVELLIAHILRYKVVVGPEAATKKKED